MTNELVEQGVQPLSLSEMQENVQIVQRVLETIMKDGTHYGVTPGCQKPSLWKPGAEKILSTFKLYPIPEPEPERGDGYIRYTVRCELRQMGSDALVGVGYGSCSSYEEKYKWRDAVCDEEWEEAEPASRRTKYAKAKGGGHYTRKQIKRDPEELDNTVLKMAVKRAMVAVTLTATAASDVFAQELEEAVEQGLPVDTEKPAAVAQPQPRNDTLDSGRGPVISDPQRKRLYAIYKQAGKNDEEVKQHLYEVHGFESSTDITRDKYEEICNWAEDRSTNKVDG